MNIILLVTQLEPAGAQRVAVELADELRARGHSVQVWFFYHKSGTWNLDNYRVLWDAQPTSLIDVGRLMLRTIAALRESRPEALISFTHYANIVGQTSARIARVPCRVVSHQNPSWSYSKAAQILDRVLGSLGTYTAIAACSQTVAATFQGYPPPYRRRLNIVRNGIRMSAEPGTRPSRIGQPEGEIRVVAAGRLVEQKNHEVLIRALQHAPNVTLQIAGDGHRREELKQLAVASGVDNRVTFLGHVRPEVMAAFLSDADVFALPSRFEGLSLVLIEALRAGLPIVASDIDSVREVLVGDQGPVGLMLPPHDEVQWGQAFALLARSERRRAELSEAARHQARAFSITRTADGFEALVAPALT